MTRFDHVKAILDAAIGGKQIHAHGPFWRGLSRDQFVAKVVYGNQLLVVGNGPGSNIVKALRGQPPFDGSDYPRMPAGMNPVADADISFIETWINEGCLEDPWPPALVAGGGVGLMVAAVPPQSLNDRHIAFWRELDNRTLYNPTPEVAAAIDAVMGQTVWWRRLAKGAATDAQWQAAFQSVQPNLSLLSNLHKDVVGNFYGTAILQSELFDSYQQFGADSLPDDPLRPDDPRHSMNGSTMWFVWSAVADACLRLNLDAGFWEILSRGIMIGSANDGLIRGRFRVVGFSADPAGQTAVLAHFSGFPAAQLRTEMTQRYLDSGL